MNNNLIAGLTALTLSTGTFATVEFSGNYEGTITDGSGATYAQDLDLKLVGGNDIAKVTVMMEDLTADSKLTANQVFVETSLEGLSFKAGTYKGQKGTGLLQAESAATNKMAVGAHVAGVYVKVNQVSGASKVTADVTAEYAGVNIKVQNVSNTDRFVTFVADLFGFGVTAETQETNVGRNTAIATNVTLIDMENVVIDVTGVYMDIEDTTGVTQDDGILGDISDANNNTTIAGVVASVNTGLGKVTGKYIDKNDTDTMVAELSRGNMEYSYTKTDGIDGVIGAKLSVAF
jgi:hypothetical protein